MKRRTIIGIAVLTAALIAGGGYAYYTKSMENEAAKDVPTVVAERMNIKSTVEATTVGTSFAASFAALFV